MKKFLRDVFVWLALLLDYEPVALAEKATVKDIRYLWLVVRHHTDTTLDGFVMFLVNGEKVKVPFHVRGGELTLECDVAPEDLAPFVDEIAHDAETAHVLCGANPPCAREVN